MAITAIPTTYRGIEFRSRLEAKWAIMFDLLDWEWEYEPIDLDGYIPDFHINFDRQNFFIEIKPAMRIEELQPAMDKATQALGEQRYETILVLGGSIGRARWGSAGHIEWGLDALMRQYCWQQVDDVYLAGCPTCQRLVPLTHEAGWGFPCCGSPDPDTHKHYRFEVPAIPAMIETYWAQATNAVKYRHAAR